MEATNTIGGKKPRNIFSRIWDWVTGRSSKSIVIEPSPVAAAEAPPPEPIRQLYDNIDKETLPYSKNLLLPDVEKDFFLSVKFMLNSGYRDGVTGIENAKDNEIALIARSRASRLFKLAKAELGGLHMKAETEEKAKKELNERCRELDVRQHHELEELQYYRRQHPRSFSRGWAKTCLWAGVLLFIADVPMSNKLFEIGFDLRWYESYAIAGGFSLCTIFIKIYYDNFIGIKYGNSLMISSRFNQMFKSVTRRENPSSEEDLHIVNRSEEKRRKKWYNGILLLTIVTIIVLGIFRTEAVKEEKGNTVHYVFYLLTFIFLSLIFPIISGICLSIGFSCKQNIERYNEAESKCNETEQKYISALIAYTQVQKEKGDIESEIAKWKEEEFSESYTQILISYYNRGYKVGLANPDSGNNEKDLYRIAESWRVKAFSRKTNNHIIKISQL